MTRLLALFLWVWVLGCTSDPPPARLHLVNVVQGASSLHVAICSVSVPAECRALDVAHASIGPWLSLKPGIHRFEISTEAGMLTTFQYGLGRGGAYALALYGIADPPVRIDWRARARELLGGIEAPLVAGYQVAHRMIGMRVPDPSAPARVRIANMDPGATKIAGVIDFGMQHVQLAPVTYAGVGDPVEAGRDEGRLLLTFSGSPLTLAERELALPPGSSSVVYVGALTGVKPVVILDLLR